MRQADLQYDMKKCEFSITKIKCLGFIVTSNGIEVDIDKVQVIKDWKQHVSKKCIQFFHDFAILTNISYGILAL